GKQLAGTEAIASYFAQEYGFAGKNSFENAQLLAAADCAHDIATLVFQLKFASDAEKEKYEKILKEKAPDKLKCISNKIKNGNVEGIEGKNGLNWADI
ncbi:hypothetical protein, partial [Salmonella sp. s51228]|uniref:hypothetical protein n=1 Tax=Salmonella sp. s51228 TaxID=3159652 RepID=UPI00397EBE3E